MVIFLFVRTAKYMKQFFKKKSMFEAEHFLENC